MFENPRILVRNLDPLKVTFVGASQMNNLEVLEGAIDEADLLLRLSDIESSTGFVKVELSNETEARTVATASWSSPNIAA